MIFDIIFSVVALGALYTGYKNGLITTIIRTIFFIAGAIGAMYFVVEYNKTGWLILAIITGAYASAWIGTQLAKTLKITLTAVSIGLATITRVTGDIIKRAIVIAVTMARVVVDVTMRKVTDEIIISVIMKGKDIDE